MVRYDPPEDESLNQIIWKFFPVFLTIYIFFFIKKKKKRKRKKRVLGDFPLQLLTSWHLRLQRVLGAIGHRTNLPNINFETVDQMTFPIYVHLFLVFTVLYIEILLNIVIVMIINISSVSTYHVSRESFLSTILYESSQLNYLRTIFKTGWTQISPNLIAYGMIIIQYYSHGQFVKILVYIYNKNLFRVVTLTKNHTKHNLNLSFIYILVEAQKKILTKNCFFYSLYLSLGNYWPIMRCNS